MLICIDSFDNGLASGHLYNYYFEGSDSFSSLDQLLFALEKIMEQANMPQASFSLRKAFPLNETKIQQKEAVQDELDNDTVYRSAPFYTLMTLKAIRGNLANYYVRVFARQHASMQGFLVDAENGATYAFRSELELICYLRDLLSAKTH